MLEVLNSLTYISLITIMSTVIAKILINKPICLSIRNILLIIAITIISTYLYQTGEAYINILLIYSLNVITYKKIFNIDFDKSIIIAFISLLITILATFTSTELTTIIKLKNKELIKFLSLTTTSCFIIYIVSNPKINNYIKKVEELFIKQQKYIDTFFIFLFITLITFFLYEIMNAFVMDYNYISNIIIFVLVISLITLFLNSRKEFRLLNHEYDLLFNYVQHFEDWVEEEQLSNHEYKNQLAVLKSISKEQPVIDKINEILDMKVNITKEVIHKFKTLPKGGLKGLIYYKLAIAQKHKINIEVDVNLKKNNVLKHLSEEQIKVLCNLIGIYFDNAIEASLETRKKTISLEIYELKGQIRVVLANTYNKTEDITNIYAKGNSSKGENRGNGLYYASKLISKNTWLESLHETIDDYFIQKLIVN